MAKSSAGRDGAFVEVIGTYNPLTKPASVQIKEERALHWLMVGAQPTETVAYMLKKAGVLDKFFAARPAAAGKFKSLDKRTAPMSQESVVAAPAKEEAKAEPKAEAAPAPAAEPEVAEVAEVAEATEVAEAPAAEEVTEAPEAPAEA